MASNRHLGRIVALQALYEHDYWLTSNFDQEAHLSEIVTRDLERYKDEIDDIDFVHTLSRGVASHIDELDEKLQPLAPDWPLAQVARIDRTILRMGLYELLHCSDDVPARVAINEAVELAKSFGSDNSSKFINGVLGTAYRTLVEGQVDDRKVES